MHLRAPRANRRTIKYERSPSLEILTNAKSTLSGSRYSRDPNRSCGRRPQGLPSVERSVEQGHRISLSWYPMRELFHKEEGALVSHATSPNTAIGLATRLFGFASRRWKQWRSARSFTNQTQVILEDVDLYIA